MKTPPDRRYGPSVDIEDAFSTFLDNVGRSLFWLGAACVLLGLGFLIFTAVAFMRPGGEASPDQALANINILSKVLMCGAIATIVGSTYMFWGEETLAILQLFGAGALFFSPFYVPSMLGGASATSDIPGKAFASIQMAGGVAGILAVCVLAADIISRMKLRAREGSRADQLKYGRGIKEEKDIKNVLMGKCWQLPFCRKFIREKCPIYHSRRTCWKERVGCMCEEEVVRNAMDNKPMPKDALLAAKYIPYNNKISMEAKKERCRNCVIYNEHQKHKYKVAVPTLLLSTIGLFVLLHPFLQGASNEVMKSLDGVLGGLTFSQTKTVQTAAGQSPIFQNLFLVCLVIVVLAYSLKVLEYAIFKLKI